MCDTTTRLRIYDIAIDDFREPTQDDLDRLAAVAQCFGTMRSILRKLSATVAQPADWNSFLKQLHKADEVLGPAPPLVT